MKFLIQGLNHVQGMFKSLGLFDLLLHVLARFQEKIKSVRLDNTRDFLMQRPKNFWNKMRAEGFGGTMRMAVDINKKLRLDNRNFMINRSLAKNL